MSTNFWQPNNNSRPQVNLNNRGFKKKNGWLKRLGVGSGVLIAIVAVVGIIGFILVIKPLLSLGSNVSALRADGRAINKALVDRDVEAMEKALNNTEKDLKEFQIARDKNVGWARNFGPTKEYYADSERFINAGLYVVAAGRETVKLVMPFADAAGLKVSGDTKTSSSETGLADAIAQWVAIMPQIADQMDPALNLLDKAGEELKPIDASKYPESIRGFAVRTNIEAAQTALSSVDQYAPDIKKALTIIPKLLGVGGEKRYMIIMQNDKEIRATGGFWTNYATFRINNAMLVNHDISSKDMYSIDLTLDLIDAVHTFPTAPAAYQRYLKVERLYARDANISPDFPTAVDKFMYFYKLAMPLAPAEIKPIDGIVAIDTEVIKELLNVTGPVTVNGVTYNKDNVVLELERTASLELREQVGRKKVLGDLMEGMMKNVFESDRNLWPKMIETGIDLVNRKHIIGYSFDQEAQALIEEYKIGGRIIDPVEGDYSYVVSTNLGGDKTNWFVKKEIDHTLSKEGNKYIDTVTIKYSYPQPGAEYSPFVKRFRDWVRVYAPLNSRLINVTGSAEEAVTDQERNKTYFTGYIELGPGESAEMTFKYELADSVVKNGVYNLYIQKQSGTNGEIHRVIVNGKTENITLTKDAEISKKL